MKILIYILILLTSCNLLICDVLQPDLKKGRTSEILSDKIIVRIKPGYDIFNKENIFRNNNFIKIEYLLNPVSSITYNTKNLNKNLNILQSAKIYQQEEKLLRTMFVYYDGKIEPEEFCKKLLLSNPAVEIAEPYYLPKLLSFVPNDPFLSMQDDFLKLIQAYEAWEIEKGNPNVIIGISDSGTNQQHEDLAGNLAINQNEIPNDGIDNDNNGYIDDYNGYNFSWENSGQNPGDTYNNSLTHGQQVSGIAAAATNNSIGIAGIGYNSTLCPMKIVDGSTLKYAYESIVYAAIRGIKVLNCSWGTVKPYSEIDQSIIDYAVSRDVAIVVAAGNTSSKSTKYDTFYPAGYYGVLGVGEVSSIDRLSSTSSLAVGCRILAPGDDNYTTTNGGYFTCDGGTSFASPVVAGAVALARAKYPNLNALQSLEFVRQAIDMHNNFSTNDRELIPGRINLYKAVTMNPFSIPGILPEKYIYTDKNNEETDRFKAGDLVNLKIITKNILGSASNLKFTLSVAHDPANSISIEQSNFNVDYSAAGEFLELKDFKILIKQNYTGNTILRVDIAGENGYKDFFKFNFVPVREISTFSNDLIKFSMSDNGEFGYSTGGSSIAGVGFTYKNYGNQIYRNSSIMFSENKSKIIYNSSLNKFYGFSSVKGFVSPDRYTGIYNDASAGNQYVGLEVTQNIIFPSNTSKAAKYKFQLKNSGLNTITDGSFGLYIDWDVSSESGKNKSKLLNAAILPEYWGTKGAAQSVYVNDNYPYFGTAVYSAENNVEAQSAGLNSDINGSFENVNRIESLNSGMSIQSTEESDYGTVVGMKFLGNWEPDEIKECSICVGAGDNEEDLAKSLKECLFGITDVVDDRMESQNYSVYPNPVINILKIKSNGTSYNFTYSLLDILGNVVVPEKSIDVLNPNEEVGIDVSNLNSSVYLLKIIENGKIQFLKIMKF
jgi:hypothetical protein